LERRKKVLVQKKRPESREIAQYEKKGVNIEHLPGRRQQGV